jgi:hypothetical protein
MKTKLSNALSLGMTTILGVALSFGSFTRAWGDDAASVSPLPAGKLFVGTVSKVHPEERVLMVDSFWSKRTFSVSDTCRVFLEDKPEAALADLVPGQKIRIRYTQTRGVRIAHGIEQQNQVHSGRIEFVDTTNKIIGVERGMVTRRFALPENVAVVVKDDKAGRVADLKVGHLVNVVYETPGKPRYVARRIEQKNPTFVGTIRSLDAATRMVSARSFTEEKQFRLADGCRIVTADNPDAGLRDLRIGDRVEFVYEEKAGVLIANRIGTEESSPAGAVGSETATANTKVPQ